jgi:hypothetical protein
MGDGKTILLMPPFYANSHDRIDLAIEGKMHQVKLNYALECTDSFAQYLFKFRKTGDSSTAGKEQGSETLQEEESQLLGDIDFESILEEL